MINFIRTFAPHGENTDISNLREALLESEYRYRQLLDAVTDYIYSVEVVKGYPVKTVHRHSSVAVTGYAPEEFEEDPSLWHKMIYPNDTEYVLDHIREIIAGKKVSSIDHRIIHKNRSVKWIKHTPVQHFDVRGELISYDGLITDITEKKRLMEQLFEAQKLESIGRLAGGVAHDFNNYLCSIMGFAELLQMKVPVDGQVFNDLGRITSVAMKASHLTRQLLAFSSRQVIERRVIDLNGAINDFCKMLRHMIGEHITINIFNSEDACCVKADPNQLDQIVINLAVNSRDAIKGAGCINIKTENKALDEREAACMGLAEGKYALLSFSDTGEGMDDETRRHIFEPFFTTKEKGKGTGLGLSTVYGIVDQHEGKIAVHSVKGSGTTFEIYFPFVDESPEYSFGTEITESISGCSGTILVVDDAGTIRETVAEALTSSGYTVHKAAGGREALECCRRLKEPLGLLLTDINMPDMNGLQLVERLKPLRNDFRTLYMTAYAEEILTCDGKPEKNLNVIYKPFRMAELLKRVRDTISY